MYIPFEKSDFTIECPIHKKTDCYMNKKCIKCHFEEQNKKNKVVENKLILDTKRKSGIRNLFINSTLENYIISSQEQQDIMSKLFNWDFRGCLLLNGAVGNGKTHLASGLLHKAIKLDKSIYFIKFYDLTDMKINNYNKYNELKDCSVLVIDDYGRSDSDFKSSLMFELIDYRYEQDLATIITTNLTNTQLKDRMDDALYSRIKSTAIQLTFAWKDYRLNFKKER